MCIAVFIWNSHPLYPFLLLLNRDEYHSRPTKPLSWWEGGDQILGGRDELAGGTWLACTRDGRVAFLTNVREAESLPQAKSRGDLPLRFLKCKKRPHEFAEELLEEADEYNGFNLIIADICSQTMVYVTNRPKGEAFSIVEVSPGIHVLSNERLDSPWHKAERLKQSFSKMLDNHVGGEIPEEKMIDTLMRDTIKDDQSMLPGIYSAEREYHLSSIFVQVATPLGLYGTRSTSALCVKKSGEVSFREKYLENGFWKEHVVIYQIEKM